MVGSSLDLTSEIFGQSTGDRFGSSIAMTKDARRFVVGSQCNSLGSSGHVRVYDQTVISTDQIGPDISGSTLESDEFFGRSIAISGSGHRMAVSAPYSDTGGLDSGEVRIYDLSAIDDREVWTKTATISADIEFLGRSGIKSGFEMAMSEDGNKLVVSSLCDGASGSVGSVRTYLHTKGSWVKTGGRLDGKGELSFFGYSQAMVSMNIL